MIDEERKYYYFCFKVILDTLKVVLQQQFPKQRKSVSFFPL